MNEAEPLGRRIVFAGKAIHHRFESAMARAGASMPTWIVLSSAHQHPGLSQTDLAARVGVEAPTLVHHLDRLCAEGLVERTRDPNDRRVTRITQPDAGRARHADLTEVAAMMDRRLKALLEDEDLATLDRVLQIISTKLEDADVYAD